jgi:hypothetical protein
MNAVGSTSLLGSHNLLNIENTVLRLGICNFVFWNRNFVAWNMRFCTLEVISVVFLCVGDHTGVLRCEKRLRQVMIELASLSFKTRRHQKGSSNGSVTAKGGSEWVGRAYMKVQQWCRASVRAGAV